MPSRHRPSESEIAHAAALLRAGKLVAFPTETVYGLGANALDPLAVARIYEVKGRPTSSPIIVHVSNTEMVHSVAADWPEPAQALAHKFWPGPLTLVLNKQPSIPTLVTAGLATVGVRMPAHPVALALIEAAQLPIAAPSANRFTQLSPTSAEHVRQGLGDRVDYLLDGGDCTVGIESTVLSLAGNQPTLLRPGGIACSQIEELIGPVVRQTEADATAHPSPGMHPRHYSPQTTVLLVRGGAVPGQGRGAYLQLRVAPLHRVQKLVTMPENSGEYAAQLYGTLYQLDGEQLDWIAVECPDDTPEWEAVLDRLRRAATPERELSGP